MGPVNRVPVNTFNDRELRSPLQRAVDGVRAMIEEGGWATGRRLPAEDALAEQLDVSRSTVRKALEELSLNGWVRRERNRGCVVARRIDEVSGIASRTILVVNDVLQPLTGVNEFGGSTAGIQHGMIDAASGIDLSALLVPMRSVNSTAERQLLKAKPRGLVVLCWHAEHSNARRIATHFHNAGVPVAAYGMDDCPEAIESYDRVISDHESGMAQLLELLARNGRKRVLRIWTVPAHAPWIAAHDRAYARVVNALGLTPVPAVYAPAMPERMDGDRAVFETRTRIMAGYIAEQLKGGKAPDAIMVATDCETFHVAAACRILGLKPGEDVLITGYDNYWHSAFERQFEPSVPFATVDKRNAAIGAELIRLLTQRIADAGTRKPTLSKIEQIAMEVHFTAAKPTGNTP